MKPPEFLSLFRNRHHSNQCKLAWRVSAVLQLSGLDSLFATHQDRANRGEL